MALLATTAPSADAVDRSSGPRPAAAAPPGKPHTVTLITGDRVTVSADGRTATFPPGGARSDVRYDIQYVKGHLSVIPTDALPLVASGRVDRRLFDLTTLIEAGYDDARTTHIPLIAAGTSPVTLARRSGVTRVKALRSISATSATVRKTQAAGLWKTLSAPGSGVRKLWLDGKRKVSLDRSVPQIGAPAAWRAGFTGKGVKVAVLDTGIDATHPDLAGRIASAANFTTESAGDLVGHGTHIASTIAGSGAASGGNYRGVATDASLLDGKVCELYGCDESAVLAGMEWAAVDQRADVVNLSLGGYDTPEVDPLEEAVDRLTAQTGALFVVAAGNNGSAPGTVSSPASAAAALAVGAVDRHDALAEFSGRGPLVGHGAVKPEVTAPGVGIVAAKSAEGQIGEPVGDRYVRLDGTSMATPHVAGAIALVAQQHPEWTASQLKATVVATANRQDGRSVFEQGAGRVDVAGAVGMSVVPDQASLSLGLQQWPHHDDKPVIRKLTYRNSAATPVELDLTASLTAPDGKAAPAGAITLSSAKLVVPARGTAGVTVVVSTAHGGTDGNYGGQVVARSGGRSLTTLVGIVKEVESYELTIKLLDAAGNLSPDASALLAGLDKANSTIYEQITRTTGEIRRRLPAGRYLVRGIVVGADRASVLLAPNLDLAADTTVRLDARLAKPFTVKVPNPAVRSFAAILQYNRRTGTGDRILGGLVAGSLEPIFAAQIGPPAPSGELVSTVDSQWALPGPDGKFTNSPVRYAVGDTRRGAMFTGLRRTVEHADLARFHTRIAVQPDQPGSRALTPLTPDANFTFVVLLDITRPTSVTEYLESRDRMWSADVYEPPLKVGRHWSRQSWPALRSVEAGRSYTENWNYAVFGPHLPSDSSAFREGDRLGLWISPFSDSAGHSSVSDADSSVTKLYRDGLLVGESADPDGLGRVQVQPGRARFRLETAIDRSSVSRFSTRISGTWSFVSDTTSQPGESLPLWVLRFHPKVGGDNHQRRSRVTVLPFEAVPTPTAKVGRLQRPVIEVSGDGGKTWRKATVAKLRDRKYVAVVATPAGAKSISLRAKAADSHGNTVQQTILAAYGLR